MEMVLCHLNYEDEDYEEQVNWLIHDNSSAVIMLGTELMEEDVPLYKNASCPFLMLDYWSWDMSFNGVLINNADSARMATEYLLRKGHEKNRLSERWVQDQSFPIQGSGLCDCPKQSGNFP